MSKIILLILQKDRKASSLKVQQILTDYGCFIKTRLGLHDGPPEACDPGGMIILDMAGDLKAIRECSAKLSEIPGVKTQLVEMSF